MEPATEPGDDPGLNVGRPRGRERHPTPLTALLLVAGFVVVLAIFAISSLQNDRVIGVLVPTRDLPAHHVLSGNDVRISTLKVRDDVVAAQYPVDGHLTLKRMHAGDPILQSDLGPNLRQVLGPTPFILGLSASPSALLGDTVDAGDHINMLVRGSDGGQRSVKAVLLAKSRNPGQRSYTLVVAVGHRDGRHYGLSLGTAPVVVTRTLETSK